VRNTTKTLDRYQTTFIPDEPVFPRTRFQGSKLKIVRWIWDAVKELNFDSVLDAFGGTGSVGYMFKCKGKEVTYNDILKFNSYIGTALVENSTVRLSQNDVGFVLQHHNTVEYPTFVRDTFDDVYFTHKENEWIDRVVMNISLLTDQYKKALAYFALFQACIIKRPFNLFHRKNLYLRFSDVKRSFGNKVTWDASFEQYFKQFAEEANRAVFSNGRQNRALNLDVFEIPGNYDLVYVDTPYISSRGVGVDYRRFYHFLEGLVNYSQWGTMIDHKRKHRPLKTKRSMWTDKYRVHRGFEKLFKRFEDSIIVVSYRSDGIPSITELKNLMKRHKERVTEVDRRNYKYVLSTNQSQEVLLIGR